MAFRSVERIKYAGRRLTDRDVDTIDSRLSKLGHLQTVVIDLKATSETSTAALAKLVRLRGQLLHNGRDLFVYGLKGRAKSMYEIYRMGKLLPRIGVHISHSKFSKRTWRG